MEMMLLSFMLPLVKEEWQLDAAVGGLLGLGLGLGWQLDSAVGGL